MSKRGQRSFAPARTAVLGLALLWTMSLGFAQGPTAAPATPPATAKESNPAAAKEEAPPSGASSVRVRVEVVNVPVTVLDKRGRPVIDLNKDDFNVYEDGVRQTIRYFSREMRPPLRIGLILDTSNSARPSLQFEKDASSEFVFNMLQGRSSPNQIFLQNYDATSSIIQDFTNEPELLNEKISALKAGGGKALFDAIFNACKEKMLKTGPPENTRRVLVLVSDGRDVQSEHTLEEAIAMARKAETLIYTIGNTAYGFSNPGDKILEQISEQTGGAAFFPREATPGTDLETGYFSHGQIGDTSQNKGLGAETGIFTAMRLMQLADSLEAIGHELDEQYSLGYTPSKARLFRRQRVTRSIASGTYPPAAR
ncbi:MAG: VWA domain-containing protein [Acidobacteriia bacterium]|nr:VWA domain-containing protein [Terriglobia bacterium]